MMVLQIIGVGGIATGGNRLDIVVLLVLLQLLVLAVAHHHLCIDAGRVGTRLTFCIERHRIALLLFLVKVGQETELVEDFVLVEIIQLARYLLTCAGNQR